MGERLARKRLEDAGFKTKDSSDKSVDFYVTINKKEYSCEVKHDVYSNRSGNLCFEVFNTKSGKPSGIAGTTCELWFHVLNEAEIYFAKAEDLKKYVETNKPFREVNGGDANSFMKLFKKDIVLNSVLICLNKDGIKEIVDNELS